LIETTVESTFLQKRNERTDILTKKTTIFRLRLAE